MRAVPLDKHLTPILGWTSKLERCIGQDWFSWEFPTVVTAVVTHVLVDDGEAKVHELGILGFSGEFHPLPVKLSGCCWLLIRSKNMATNPGEGH